MDVEPSWSPDGKKIAFTSIVIMTAAELGIVKVTPTSTKEPIPMPHAHIPSIWVVSSDGSEKKQLTTYPPKAGIHPSWSPDGRKIAFLGVEDKPKSLPRIEIINIDETDQIKLNVSGLNPSWSPDGNKIAFERSGDIWIVEIQAFQNQTPGFEAIFVAIAIFILSYLMRVKTQ
jgi:Tol biopolymer transport system component